MELTKIILFILVCTLLGCERKSNISITVKNVDVIAIDSVALFVTGNSYQIGTILPNDSVITKVHPRGESHLEIVLKTSRTGRKRFIVPSYFESGYSGFMNVSINSDSVVSVIDSISISKYKYCYSSQSHTQFWNEMQNIII
jgi:hypothetical protein